MNPGQHDMAGHLADRPRVVPVIGEPGIGSVPVGEQRGSRLHVGSHKSLDRSRGVVWDRGETDTSRPSIQVFRSFPPWLGLVCAAVDHLDSAGDKDLPGFHGIEKAIVGPERNFGLIDLHHALQRLALGISIIDRRSFCASNQAVLYVMPSWASSWTADMPFECVAMRCAAQNHTVSGNLDRCIAVPAVIDVWRPQSRHSWVCARPLNNAARPPPQAGQTNPCGQRRSNKNAAQLRSSGKARLKLAQRSRPSHPISPPARRRSSAHATLILHIDQPGTAG